MFKMPFGKFKGLTLEQILFKPRGRKYPCGYEYLKWIAQEIREGKWENDVPELKWIDWTFKQSQKVPIKASCVDCDKPAVWTSIRGSREFGYSMSEEFIYCDQCKKEREHYYEPKTQFLRLHPASINWFAVKFDQMQFIALLRKVYGMPEHLTAKYLRNLFTDLDDHNKEEDNKPVTQEVQSTLF